MVEFSIRLGGVVIGVTSEYPIHMDSLTEYLTSEAPTLFVRLGASEVQREGCILQNMSGADSAFPQRCSKEACLSSALCRKAADALLPLGILLFHGTAVWIDGGAYLFTAPSGTGKTTHAKLWLKNIPGCHIINGDKPFLRFKDARVDVCGSPWQGKERFGVNEESPLKGICLLERSAVNRMERISFGEALPILLQQSYHAARPDLLSTCLTYLAKLDKIPLFRLQCNMEDDAARVAYRTLTDKGSSL